MFSFSFHSFRYAVLIVKICDSFYLQPDYSEKYQDGNFEYRHVILPKEQGKTLPKNRTLTEVEWRGIGVQQSRGWEHYASHRPEPHILLFRRPLGTVIFELNC